MIPNLKPEDECKRWGLGPKTEIWPVNPANGVPNLPKASVCGGWDCTVWTGMHAVSSTFAQLSLYSPRHSLLHVFRYLRGRM